MESVLTFNANDNTSSAISGIIANLTGLGAIGATALQGLIGITSNLTQKIMGFAWEITQVGAVAEALQGKFDLVFAKLAGEVTQQLIDFGQAAGRSKYDLMTMAANFQDTLVPMGFARDEAAEMSVAMTKLAIDLASFNDISDQEAFVRLQGAIIGNTENLLKFGVVATAAQLEQFALNKELWDGQGVMDPLTKATAIYMMTVEGTKDAQNDAINTAWQFNNTMKALESVFSELKTEMGLRLVPEFGKFMSMFKEILPAVQQMGAGFAGTLGNIMSIVHRFISGFFTAFLNIGAPLTTFQKALKKMGGEVEEEGGRAKKWGHDLIVNFAKGMAEAVSYIVRVLQYIGDIITYWLQPHSPPKILPEIDKWGLDTMTEYIKGFGQADLSLFDNIANQVSTYIKSALPDDDELGKIDISNKITISRQVIAQNIALIKSFRDEYFDSITGAGEMTQYLAKNIQDLGYYTTKMSKDFQAGIIGNIEPTEEWNNLVKEAINQISLSAGGLPNAYQEYLEVLFNSEYATAQVAQAQEELNAVTEHFANLLSPLNAELQGINDRKEEIRNQQRLQQLQEIIADETKTAQEKELAQLEIRSMELESQIKQVEKEGSLATSIAEEKLRKAQEHEQKVKEELQIKQQILSIGQEQNNLLQEQADLMKQLLESMAEGMDKAAKGLTGAANDIKEALGDTTDWGKAPAAISVFQETFDEIDDIFSDLQPASQKLGETWGEIFETVNENFVVKVFTAFYTGVVKVKDGFDELIRKADIFQTLMTSDSVVNKLRNIRNELGQVLVSLMSGNSNTFFKTLDESLPTIKKNLFGFLDDFGRNFKATFGIDLTSQITALKNILEGLFDKISPTLKKIEEIAISIKKWIIDKFNENKEVINSITQSFTKLYEIFNKSGWQILKSTLEQLALIIGGILTVAFAVFVGVVEAGLVIIDGFLRILTIIAENLAFQSEQWEKYKAILSALFEAINQGDFSGLIEQIVLLQVTMLDSFFAFMGTMIEIIWVILKSAVTAIGTLFYGVVDTIAEALTGVDIAGTMAIWKENFRLAIVIVTALWEGFKTYNSALITYLYDKFIEWKNWFIEIFQYGTEMVLNAVYEYWIDFQEELEVWRIWFEELIQAIIDKVTEWGDKFLGYITDIINNNELLKLSLQFLREKVDFVLDAIKGAWQGLKTTLINIYNDYIKPMIIELGLEFYTLWDDLKQYFYDIGMWIIGMKDNFITMVNAILAKIQPLLDAIETLAGAGEGSTSGGANPEPSPRGPTASSASDVVQLNTTQDLPQIQNDMKNQDFERVAQRQRSVNQTWNITFNQQNSPERDVLEDMRLVQTFMGS